TPANWPGSLLLSPENLIFPPLQPDHSGRGGDLQLCHIGDPRLGDPVPSDDQLAVLPNLAELKLGDGIFWGSGVEPPFANLPPLTRHNHNYGISVDIKQLL
ncbi:TPA: hypothetical protein ACQVJ0_005248, partial [Serratia marcescens]